MSLNTAYCACSTEKTKTRAHMSGKFEHNLRLHDVINADASKRELNEILVGDETLKQVFQISMDEARSIHKKHGYKTYVDSAEETKKMVEETTGRKVRKDAVLEVEVVLTYSSSANDGMDIDEWKKANVEWLEEFFGKENVVCAVLHMDESTPHIHAMVTPIDRESGEPRFNAKKWLGGKAMMSKMQDNYAKAMEKFGLERGEKNSKAKHRDLHDFYRALNNVARKKAPKREDFKTPEAYEAAVDQIYNDMKMSLFALEEKIRRLEEIDKTRESNNSLYRKIAESKITDYEEQIQILKSDLSESEKKAKVVDHIQLAIKDVERTNPDEASRLREELNSKIKAGGKIAAAMERLKAKSENQETAQTETAPTTQDR